VKKLLLLLIILAVAVIIGTYWLPSYRAGSDHGFKLIRVEPGSLVDLVSATGIVEPRDLSVVASEVSGEVVKIFPEADFDRQVHKDQPLLQLDDRMARLKLDEAEVAVRVANAYVQQASASLEAAQVALKRQRELLQKNLTAQAEVERADHQYKAALANLKAAHVKVDELEAAARRARLAVDLTTVRAPAAGTIIDRKVVLGQMIAPPASSHLFTIASDLERMQVSTQVAEGDIGKIHLGQPATFSVYAYSDGDVRFQAKVELIHPQPANEKGAVYYTVMLDATNRRDPNSKDGNGWMLRPGMTANVEIRLREHANTWKLPLAVVNFQLDPIYQTEAAKDRLAEWQARSDAVDWQTVWTMKNAKPWPIFVRTGGTNAGGQTGIKDAQFYEVLQWDDSLDPRPDPKNDSTFPRVINQAPPKKQGFFDKGNIKL
jgi:HlyD family secretion protein